MSGTRKHTGTAGNIARTIAVLRAIHVETERDHELSAQLRRLLQTDGDGNLTPFPVRFTADLETRGIALIEPAGGGKTTAVREVLRSLDALGPDPDTGMPRVVQIQVQSPASQKGIGMTILGAVGINRVSSRATASEIFDLIRRRFTITGTTVLWIDEAHDMFLSRSARETDDMLKMLKGLMQGDAAVIVILSGTERLFEITSYDPQVNRRFTKIIPTDLQIGIHNSEIGGLIETFCSRAGLTFDPAGSVVNRLIHGSRKRFGRAIETVINAIEIALTEGAAVLDQQHFAEAWGMQEGCSWDRNVFICPDWEAIELDVQAKRFETERSLRQQRILSRG